MIKSVRFALSLGLALALSASVRADELDALAARMDPNVVTALRNCLAARARANEWQFEKLLALNANLPLMLTMACDGFDDAYIWQCQQLGKSVGTCATFLNMEAERIVANFRKS